MNNKKIGLAVEDRMHFLGLNQKSFAESLFMTEKELKEYLRGKKDFSLELIELIALNLKTTPEDLMFSKNNMTDDFLILINLKLSCFLICHIIISRKDEGSCSPSGLVTIKF